MVFSLFESFQCRVSHYFTTFLGTKATPIVEAWVIFGEYGFNKFCLMITVQETSFQIPVFTYVSCHDFKVFLIISSSLHKGKQRESSFLITYKADWIVKSPSIADLSEISDVPTDSWPKVLSLNNFLLFFKITPLPVLKSTLLFQICDCEFLEIFPCYYPSFVLTPIT